MKLLTCCWNVISGILERLGSVVHCRDGGIVGTLGSLKVIEHEAILACLYQAKCRYINDAS